GAPADALRLAAAATSWCRAAGAPTAVDAQVAGLRAVAARSLSAEELAAAWDEGRVLTLEQVIDRVMAAGAAPHAALGGDDVGGDERGDRAPFRGRVPQ